MKTNLLFLTVAIFILCMKVEAQSWMQENGQTLSRLRNINFADSNTGWFFGDSSDINGFVTGIVKKTNNQGNTWTPQFLGSKELRVYSSYFLDVSTGFVAGRHNAQGIGFVSKTNDGGITWITDSTSFPERLMDIDFADNLNSWVSGRNGLISKTSDGGTTWIAQNSTTGEHLFSIDFCNTNVGWSVGADPGTGGVILRTTDSGLNWVAQTNAEPNDLMAVYAFNPAKALAVGFAGTIVMTLDSGLTWTPIMSGTLEDLNDVTFVDANNGWACGTAGTIIITTDGGLTWTPQNSNNAGNTIFSLSMKSTTLGWYCGDAGDVFYYSLWPLSLTESNLESDLNVYPNPASENVTFSLDGSIADENTSIIILDITGKIIRLLPIATGQQQVTIQLDGIPSGCYTYELSFSDKTKCSGKLIKF